MKKLESLYNYKNTYSLSKTISIVVLITSCIIVLASYFFVQNTLDKYKGNVYIVTKDGVWLNAEISKFGDPKTFNIEARAHVRKFYENWYQFDQFNFQSNIDEALNLIGESGKELKLAYDKEGLFNKLKQFNMRCEVEIDSIIINNNNQSIEGSIYGKQYIIRPNSKLARKMNANFNLNQVERGDNNPHGLLIENWVITDNELIPY